MLLDHHHNHDVSPYGGDDAPLSSLHGDGGGVLGLWLLLWRILYGSFVVHGYGILHWKN